jgi:hypothetical protein
MSTAGETLQESMEGAEYWKRVEVLQVVAQRLEDVLKEKLEDTDISDIECGEFLGQEVVCDIGRKYYGIAEMVAQDFEWYCAGLCEEEGLSEEECEKKCEEEFWVAYEEELEQINKENVIGVEASIDASLCAIIIQPLLCDGDDCFVGARVHVSFKVDIEHLKDENYREYLLGKVAEVVSTILNEL